MNQSFSWIAQVSDYPHHCEHKFLRIDGGEVTLSQGWAYVLQAMSLGTDQWSNQVYKFYSDICDNDGIVISFICRGGGGQCVDCQHNTQGVNCEQCIDLYYRDLNKELTSPDVCLPCDCDPAGTVDGDLQCDTVRAATALPCVRLWFQGYFCSFYSISLPVPQIKFNPYFYFYVNNTTPIHNCVGYLRNWIIRLCWLPIQITWKPMYMYSCRLLLCKTESGNNCINMLLLLSLLFTEWWSVFM